MSKSTVRLCTWFLLACIALSVLWCSGFAQATEGGRALELKDYYRIETIGAPAISPDGRRVAFTRNYIVETENQHHSEIWIVPADGSSAPVRLTNPAFSASNPRWSPDGTLLAFTSRRKLPGAPTGERESDGTLMAPRGKLPEAPAAERESDSVWFLRMDQPSGEAFQIPGVSSMPIFSPDNQWIAFTKKTPPPKKPTKQYASDFERLIHERFKGRIYDWMNFRFDGRGYLPDPRDPAATPPEELYLVPRAGGPAKQLTWLGVNVQAAIWRPDSSALVIQANAHQRDEYTYERDDLWIVKLDGQTQRLTDDGFHHTAPAWSPDGRTLIFRRAPNLNMIIQAKQNHGGATDVYRMPAEGGRMENLTTGWDLLPGEPSCGADGRFIYFSGGIGGGTHLFRVAASGGPVQQMTQGERRLGHFSFSAAFDRMAYTAGDPTHPVEIFVSRPDGGEEKRLTGFHDAMLKEVHFNPAQRIQYPSKDGTPIEGWAIFPRNSDSEKGPYPMILSLHGGPHGAYGNDFSFHFQLWAANGYVVLYTNPRGSTGYGEKFVWATWGGWGNLDYEDVMAGVDYMLAHHGPQSQGGPPRIDGKRLGVAGYSYGGYLTNWIITRTPRFAAAIAGAGISNWVSDYGTADIPRTKESEFYGPPWEDVSGALLWKQSPIAHAATASTPTLFVHGELDTRVPIEQVEQMYTALKKRRVPAKFIRYPDSYHGGWSPWNTLHREYQQLKWWNQYLSPKSHAAQDEHSHFE